VRCGHAIENHSQRHLHRFSLLGPRALAQEIGARSRASRRRPGRSRVLSCARGLAQPFLEPVLARANLRLVSWTRRGFDTVSGSPARVLGRLTRHLQSGDILLLHDDTPRAPPPAAR